MDPEKEASVEKISSDSHFRTDWVVNHFCVGSGGQMCLDQCVSVWVPASTAAPMPWLKEHACQCSRREEQWQLCADPPRPAQPATTAQLVAEPGLETRQELKL